ncbi:MAG: polynucleotide 5'-hydroxyl-kinase, partial [Chloroflexota bacterium]|nr:polynucleotide 5'-hydroxyl-kinase [Chloroflexota bacterium]
MVIGQSDSGKTAFARYLFQELCRLHSRVGFLDCDMGQSTLGPPTTMTLALSALGGPTFPPRGKVVSYFVGSTSPRGHMLPTVIGAYKLQRRAQELGAEAIVVDTTGLVAQQMGGGELKQWKIELLQPSTLVGIERGAELEHILWPWRWDRRVRVYELPVCEYVTEKSRTERISYRERRFRHHFEEAHNLEVPLGKIVAFGMDRMTGNRLLALQDEWGFALALGVAKDYDRNIQTLAVTTPLPSLDGVSSIRFGSLKLDPTTGREL